MNIASTTSQPPAPVRIQATSSEAGEAPGVNDNDADDMAGSSAPDVRAAPPAGQGTVIDRVA
ncbi:MAG: hypothetical protein KKF33_06090 [Alphaproteobacteria bacterium]|nr:hypothetical protein [Alphaproteobacteria bacterium]